MASQIVDNDNVPGLEGWDQLLFDIGTETLAVDWTVKDTWRRQSVTAQGCQKCHGAPTAMRGIATQSLALGAPAAQRRHVGLDPGLVNEHKALGIKLALPGFPSFASPRDITTGLLICEQAFF